MTTTTEREMTQAESELFAEIEEAGHDIQAVQTYREWVGEEYSKLEEWESWISDFEEAYQGEMSTEDFAEQLANDLYLSGKDVPQWVVIYFDYEKWERDLFMGDYYESNGFIFRSI
jgi:antirestriction protein